jgi:ABC-2 type transport system ATP-binding protein
VLFATHYLEEADAYADRIVLISKGSIVADGSAAEVKNMAAGRTVSATLPDVDQLALAAIPGVTSVEVRGERVRLHSSDSDIVLRYLLLHTEARDLEVTSRNLEDAFVALTSDQPDQTSENGQRLNGADPHTQPAPAGTTRRSQS